MCVESILLFNWPPKFTSHTTLRGVCEVNFELYHFTLSIFVTLVLINWSFTEAWVTASLLKSWRLFFCIRADVTNPMVWMVLILSLIFLSLFYRPLGMVPNIQAIISITVTFIFCTIFTRTDYYYYYLLIRVFHISVSWWFFTGVWVIASLLKSPGLFSVFWPFSIM